MTLPYTLLYCCTPAASRAWSCTLNLKRPNQRDSYLWLTVLSSDGQWLDPAEVPGALGEDLSLALEPWSRAWQGLGNFYSLSIQLCVCVYLQSCLFLQLWSKNSLVFERGQVSETSWRRKSLYFTKTRKTLLMLVAKKHQNLKEGNKLGWKGKGCDQLGRGLHLILDCLCSLKQDGRNLSPLKLSSSVSPRKLNFCPFCRT